MTSQASEGAKGSSDERRKASYSASDLDEEMAQAAVLESLEQRRGRNRTASGEDFRTAVEGERPLLGSNVSFQKMYNVYGDQAGTAPDGATRQTSIGTPTQSGSRKTAPKLSDIARRVMMKRQSVNAISGATSAARRAHKRSQSSAHALLECIQEDSTGTAKPDRAERGPTSDSVAQTNADKHRFFDAVGTDIDVGNSMFAVEDSQVDRLVTGAVQVEKLFEEDNGSVTSEGSVTIFTPTASDEQLPLLETSTAQQGRQEPYGSAAVQVRRQSQRRRHRRRKLKRRIMEYCNPMKVIPRLWNLLKSAYFLWAALPLFAGAWVLYYYCGNPEFDFMPGHATLSWWFNFIGRHLITLQLAFIVQWLVIDCFILGSKTTVRLLGPLVTLLAIQSKGWPFVVSAWSILDMILLHGNNTFQTHWFYWTSLKIYSQANSGSYILSSEIYLRVLLSMLLAGIAVSVKRTAVAVYFGRRTFAEFKPRLEKILKDIVLLSEVAELAEQADHIDSAGTAENYQPKQELGKGIGSVKWQSVDPLAATGEHDLSVDYEDDDEESSADVAATNFRPQLSISTSGSFRIKDLLDRWEEPVNKLDKTSDASIRDILKFRRALSYMDESHPFGEAFGPAATRDECIESAHSVYWRLLKLTPDTGVLSNDILVMLAVDEDDHEIPSKKNALRKLFRPDRYNQLPLLAFIQSCDTLYKKLRYFRASVGNASVIDHVLEGIIDAAFSFVLFLIILSFLNFNPWPLLVSLSTLLVSFSFAMGSSASKWIEGVLLIALRRPYDLGDRIVLSGADGANPGVAESWFVEDINLYATTLRFAGSNEIATVSNGNIAGCRINNCNRSPNAVVILNLVLHISLVEEDKVGVFNQAIQNYVDEHPRIWDCMIFFRFENLDNDMEQVTCRMAMRHRNSWQDAPRILRDRGELQKFIYTLGEKMDVNFDSPPARTLLYSGGILKSGQVDHYKKNLLLPANIKNYEKIEETAPASMETDVANALYMAQLQKSNEAS